MLLTGGLVLATAACGPGSSVRSDGEASPSTSVKTDLSGKDYQLTLWDGAGLKAIDDALIQGFQKKHPNIKIKANYDPDNVSAQNGPRVISSKDAPDIARLTDVNTAVRGKHVISLEPYVKAYGWKVPQSQTELYRVDNKGQVGSGTLYALPNSFSVAGIYVNTKMAKKLGIEKMPATLQEFETDMAKAKEAGEIPMMTNGKDGGLSQAFQAIMVNADTPKPVSDWIMQRPGATFDTAGAKMAAEHLQSWSKRGYLAEGVNAIDASSALNRFVGGQGLFFPSGNWNLDLVAKSMGEDVEFIPFPANKPGQQTSIAANAGSFFGIPKNSSNADAAACFLDYTQGDEARQIIADSSGYFPKTVKGQSLPKPHHKLQQSMFSSYLDVFDSGNSTDFINNATAGIQSGAFVPNFQLLLDGSITPEQFPKNIQKEYQSELGR